jgi:putative heme-binding domain-containing protein
MKYRNVLLTAGILATLHISDNSFAQKDLTQSVRTKIFTPEEELAGFRLAPGFVIELVASERDSIVNPVDLTFDDAGRLWTQTARMYPLDPVADIQWDDLLRLMDNPQAQKSHPNFKRILDLYQGKTKGSDKIIVISDLYGKTPARASIWADGLTIPMSILPYKNGAYVAQGSELFFLNDDNKDGKADKRIPMLTGFGFTDTHTMTHTLVRGPGDWIHFSHGALNKGEVSSLQSGARLKIDFSKIARFSLDAKKMELVSVGLNNIWGFQLRHNGEWYGSEANDLGYSVTPMDPGSGFPGIGNEHLRPYQPFLPPLHEFRVGGTGISGTAFADDISGSFPEEYRNVAFLANPITSTINAVQIVHNEDGTITSRHLPDLLTSADDWFRPVNMEFGPDGCLYIADWYNKIVSHNELPTTHPDRDKTHGRIWRIRHVSQTPRSIPDLYQIPAADLVNHLKSPSLWEKRAAWHQISDRPIAETRLLAAQLVALASDVAQDPVTRIHALWSLEGIRHKDIALLTALMQSPVADIRREAVRSLSSFSVVPSQVASALKTLIEDKNPAVRAQVLRTLTELGNADETVIDLLVKACKPELGGNAMGGSYERKQERFLARRALEGYAAELQKYVGSAAAQEVPAVNMLWAAQALPAEQRDQVFLKFWPAANMSVLDESTFIAIAGMLKNKEVATAIRPVIENPSNARTYVNFALRNQSQVQSPELSQLLAVPVNTLLTSGVKPDADLALDAIGRFTITGSGPSVVGLINDETPERTMKLALKALDVNPAENQQVFAKIAKDNQQAFDIRTTALNSLCKANPGGARDVFLKWVPQLDAGQKSELTSVLSSSVQGSALLINMHEKKLIGLAAFDLAAAERVVNSHKNDKRGTVILSGVKKREEENKRAFDGKLARYMAVAAKNDGNAENGKLLFQTCLSCHEVGGQGQNIAPALDGSASRENEALLTAILNPDAAVESGYSVYRVSRKDGTSTEGYLVSKNEQGTTLAFMGGAKVFIEAAAIKSQGFLGGRSFMVKGLIDGYTDKQVADLLSYIKTLK